MKIKDRYSTKKQGIVYNEEKSRKPTGGKGRMQEKRRKGRKTAGIWIGLLLSLCACSWQTGEEDRKEAAALERTEEGTGDAETEALREAESL